MSHERACHCTPVIGKSLQLHLLNEGTRRGPPAAAVNILLMLCLAAFDTLAAFFLFPACYVCAQAYSIIGIQLLGWLAGHI